jgi:hypothetical protein
MRNFHRKISIFVFLILAQILLCACAGPTTPFGAIHDLFPSQKIHQDILVGLKSNDTEYEISFYPKNHIYHKNENLTVTIRGKKRFPDISNLKLIYNSTDITDVFLKSSEIKTYPNDNLIRIEFSALKLSAKQIYKIDFLYFNEKRFFAFSYNKPSCPLKTMTPAKGLHGFDVPAEYIGLVNRSGREERINPSLIAGLVAMESGFNPHAVSSAKAIGLTQITDIAVDQIQKKTENWPRRDLSSLSTEKVKEDISSGILTSDVDWRLEPSLSLKGGANYLKYIVSYWKRAEQKKLLADSHITTDEQVTDVVLASYNNGPERIRRSITKKQKNWLNDPENSKVRYYINMIYSYCHYFSEGPQS